MCVHGCVDTRVRVLPVGLPLPFPLSLSSSAAGARVPQLGRGRGSCRVLSWGAGSRSDAFLSCSPCVGARDRRVSSAGGSLPGLFPAPRGSPPPVGPTGKGQPVGSKLPVTLKRPSPPVRGPGEKFWGEGVTVPGHRPGRQKTPKVGARGAGAAGGTGRPRGLRWGRFRYPSGGSGASFAPRGRKSRLLSPGLLEPVCAGGSGSPLPRRPGPPLAAASTKTSQIHPKCSRGSCGPVWAVGAR